MAYNMVLRKRNLNVDMAEPPLVKNGSSKRKSGHDFLEKLEHRSEKIQLEKRSEMVDPAPDVDYDKETRKDLNAVAEYAQDIFNYYKYREKFFKIHDYFRHQTFINRDSRAILVNWMVELQETFELNHETLYLAVKMLDLYLDRVPAVEPKCLQLIASASVFISSKYDERYPPSVKDLMFVSNESFKREALLKEERCFFRTVGLDLGMPISYRFLRRYARVCKVDMPMLTLARYILETSLMFFEFCRVSESLIAVACFLLALRMKDMDWTLTLQKYSGYKKEQVEPLVFALNHMIIKRESSYAHLDVVFKKYSHEIFMFVAETKSLPDIYPLSDPILPPMELLNQGA
uniref:G2/mitotic-specific cyclin-B3 n=1 Tax=Ditylenchus dipsaci TaxID=166011 RepID=A0A915CRC2_9BILA